MKIELQRLQIPEDLGRPEVCGICETSFELGIVWPYATTTDGYHIGALCTACVEHMGRHPSGHFPTIEELRRLEAEWQTPLYSSAEEANAAFLAEWEATRD